MLETRNISDSLSGPRKNTNGLQQERSNVNDFTAKIPAKITAKIPQ
jgi:hypothetical protein